MTQLLGTSPVYLYPCYLYLKAGHIEAQRMFGRVDGWMKC